MRHREAVERVIDFLEIQAIRKTPVGRLPYGLQKRVELGRALAAEPDMLLLDEPMAGMNVEEKEDMSRFIIDVNEEFGTTIVLIEHDMGVVMDLSDRVVVLDYGKLIADGDAGRGAQRPGSDRRLSRRRARLEGSGTDGILRRPTDVPAGPDGRSDSQDRRPPRAADPDHRAGSQRRRDVLADRARLRADLQGVRRVQLRAGHHGGVRRR